MSDVKNVLTIIIITWVLFGFCVYFYGFSFYFEAETENHVWLSCCFTPGVNRGKLHNVWPQICSHIYWLQRGAVLPLLVCFRVLLLWNVLFDFVLAILVTKSRIKNLFSKIMSLCAWNHLLRKLKYESSHWFTHLCYTAAYIIYIFIYIVDVHAVHL